MGKAHRLTKIIIILMMLPFYFPVWSAEVYRWVDKDGVTHLTDSSPEGIKEARSLSVPDPDSRTETNTQKRTIPEKKAVIPAAKEPGSLHRIKHFPIVHQERRWCALASIEMIARYYGFNIDQRQVSLEADIPYEEGMTLNGILKYFERLKPLMLNIDYYYGGNLDSVRRLIDNGIPMIWLHHAPAGKGWTPHAAVVIGYDDVQRRMVVADPAFGSEVILSYKEFLIRWYRTNNLVVAVSSKLSH